MDTSTVFIRILLNLSYISFIIVVNLYFFSMNLLPVYIQFKYFRYHLLLHFSIRKQKSSIKRFFSTFPSCH